MRFRIIIFLLSLPFAVFAALSGVEEKIVQQVKKDEAKALALLETLVNINSGTNNIKGVRQVGERLKPLFQQLGFKTRWEKLPASMHRAPTFVAEHRGTQGKRLLIIGHLDTVFSQNSRFKRFKRQGERATGPGVLDDKSGDVIILYALKALKSVSALDNKRITVVLTGDEEDSGKPSELSRRPLIKAAENSDLALDFEFAITQDTATVARRGISQWRVEAKGEEGHSAIIFKKNVGAGAIYELSRILNAFREQFSEEKTVSLNTGLIAGGTLVDYEPSSSKAKVFGKENVIPKTALATGDLRFISPEEEESLSKKMRTIVADHLADTRAKISFEKGIPAMTAKPENLALLEKYSAVSEDLGFGTVKALPSHLRGAGDISHIAGQVSGNLAGLGGLGEGSHSPLESLEISSLSMQTQRAALLIYRLTHD